MKIEMNEIKSREISLSKISLNFLCQESDFQWFGVPEVRKVPKKVLKTVLGIYLPQVIPLNLEGNWQILDLLASSWV